MSRGQIFAVLLIAVMGAYFITRPADENVDVAGAPNTSTEDAQESQAMSEHEATLSGVHLDALDLETRAQDDFYQFANGGWLDNTEIPEIYSGYTVYHQVNEVAEEALKTIIESAGANPR